VGSYFELGNEFSGSIKGRALLDWSVAVQIVPISPDGIPCSKAELTHNPGRRIIFFFKYFSTYIILSSSFFFRDSKYLVIHDSVASHGHVFHLQARSLIMYVVNSSQLFVGSEGES
jgi:hypothetical protein